MSPTSSSIQLNVSNPAKPVRLGSYADFPENALQVVDTRVYLWRSVLDVRNPAAPAVLGYYQGGNDVQVAGNRAYFAAGGEGLRVLDVSAPAGPVLVDSYRASSGAGGLHSAGDHVYLQDDFGLLVVDVSDPARPVIVGHHAVVARDVGVAGNLAYVVGRIPGREGYDDVFTLTARLEPGHPLAADRAVVRGFTLEARGDDQAPIGELSQPYTLTLGYTRAQLQAALVGEETLVVLAWDG